MTEFMWAGKYDDNRMNFALADDTTVRRAGSECDVSLPQGGPTPR